MFVDMRNKKPWWWLGNLSFYKIETYPQPCQQFFNPWSTRHTQSARVIVICSYFISFTLSKSLVESVLLHQIIIITLEQISSIGKRFIQVLPSEVNQNCPFDWGYEFSLNALFPNTFFWMHLKKLVVKVRSQIKLYK